MLPITSYTENTAQSEDLDQCSICLNPFLDESLHERMTTICNHFFHTNCLKVWLESHPTCPMCRVMILPTHNNPPSVYSDEMILCGLKKIYRSVEEYGLGSDG